jgi:ABC-type Fe3+/spermidine/putrescine transport system ATPase subunit
VALVTHELREAFALADRVAVVCGGAVAQVGPRDEVLRRPTSARVAALVGMANLLPGRVVGRSAAGFAAVELAGGGRLLADAANVSLAEPVVAGVRPEHVKIDADGGDRGFVGHGRVRELVSDGALVTVWIEWEGAVLRAHLLAGRGLGHELKPGTGVRVAVRPEDVHLIAREP